MWNVIILVLLSIIIIQINADCFTTAVSSTADCFQAITCDTPSTITTQMESCRKTFNSGIVKSRCSEEATMTPASTISIVKALITLSEASQCTSGMKFPAEDIATALRQQVATVDAKEAAAGIDDDGLVLNKKQRAAENPLLISTTDNRDSAGKRPGGSSTTSMNDAAELSSTTKTSMQDNDEAGGSGTRTVGSKPGLSSLIKKVGGTVGGVATSVAGGAVRSNPVLNAVGGVIPQKNAKQAAPASDDSAAAAVANAGAAVASAGAVIAKTSADERDEKEAGEKRKNVEEPRSKLVAVEHNGRLAKVVEVGGGEEAAAPKPKVINVEDDEHDADTDEHAPRTSSKNHVHPEPDIVHEERRHSSRLPTVADDSDPSVIVDSRGRFSIPDDQVVKPKKRTMPGRTEITEIRTTTKLVGDESGGDRPTSALTTTNNGTTNSTQASSVIVNVNHDVAAAPTTTNNNWLLIGLLSGLAFIVLIVVFFIIRRIRAAP